ncbi:hypothetical protein FXN61_17890 [Lentzea sp. PSKA42]|uniref:GIY-YIG nuclease family protein n=1 Tax=Lentzea indica TaxID=2604800 RepID=A0ABX1FJ36_9PSEU|nr:hypothetical protein [Lentzea indica]NKE58588.1 hypothetical protein [Lentzea indica]
MRAKKKTCANCLRPVHGSPGGRGRGRAVAWHAHCPPCAQLVADQMETVLSIERTRGAPLQVRRCRWCGAERACPGGWATRCHLCLDERTSPEIDLVRQAAASGFRTPLREAAQLVAVTTLVDVLAQFGQPGWTVIAGDVLGLPWTDDQYTAKSHGTWGRHDACGRIQVMSRGRDECATCPPEPRSRTHRARAEDTHLLYLVRHGDFVKFGRGYHGRVRSHVRSGATPIQVLTARHADVHIAELTLKRRHVKDVARGIEGVPASFGTGTEVLPIRLSPDLLDFLPHGEDVTHRFVPLR